MRINLEKQPYIDASKKLAIGFKRKGQELGLTDWVTRNEVFYGQKTDSGLSQNDFNRPSSQVFMIFTPAVISVD